MSLKRAIEITKEVPVKERILKTEPKAEWGRPPRPFVKWAGGKNQLLTDLEQRFPDGFQNYYEPFLGGGAVFFRVMEKHLTFSAVLSDVNDELMNAYCIVKEKVEDLIELLRFHKARFRVAPRDYYYEVRDHESSDTVEKAARLIFLNKTCYNGLYRVNRHGKFNVPLGRHKNPRILDEENLLAVSKALRTSRAKLLVKDYQEATQEATKGDFIYFDPPYQPVSSTANFTSYTREGFSYEEQRRLSEVFRELDKKGCLIVLSNSDTEEIRKLYGGYNIKTVPVLRAISCKRRKGYTELIVSNFKRRA